MYEVIGRGANGDVMVLDYEDFMIEKLTAQELQEAKGMSLQIQERNPISLDNYDFSEKSMGMSCLPKRDLALIKLFEKSNNGVIFALFDKRGLFVPSVEFSLMQDDGTPVHEMIKVTSLYIGHQIGSYYFFRLDLGCNTPALLKINAQGTKPFCTRMREVSSIWSKYFVSIPGLIDMNTLQYQVIPVGDDNMIGYKNNAYKLAKSSRGEIHLVGNYDGKSKCNVSKYLGL